MGDYVRDGAVEDLTDDNLRAVPNGFIVDAPAGTSEVRVSISFIEDRFGSAWAADHVFTVSDGQIIVDAEDVAISEFVLGPDEVFTFGSDDNIRFLDRPMWVSARTTEKGVEITAYDGNSAGQIMQLNQDWLVDLGVSIPLVVHEDGTVLDISNTDDGKGFVVDVPHFSSINVINADLDQSWMTEGFTFFYDLDYRGDGVDFSTKVNITVSAVTAGFIGFRGWKTESGTTGTLYEDDRYSRETRESQTDTGKYSFNFINVEDLLNGEAEIGFDTAPLVDEASSAYIFSEGNATYYYHIEQGWLKRIYFKGNGTEGNLTAYAWGTGTDYPAEADQLPSIAEPAVIDGTWNQETASTSGTQTCQHGLTWDHRFYESIYSVWPDEHYWSDRHRSKLDFAATREDGTVVELDMEVTGSIPNTYNPTPFLYSHITIHKGRSDSQASAEWRFFSIPIDPIRDPYVTYTCTIDAIGQISFESARISFTGAPVNENIDDNVRVHASGKWPRAPS